jgi:2-polyprenyl-6-methoxyphenol hydroxylase-like FAD-dependent oxidoreductase
VIVEFEDLRTGGPDLPATLGVYRPALARILLDRAVEAGAEVRFGTTYTSLGQDETGVAVTFADGSAGRYDLVVGADGIRSWTDDLTGELWQAFTDRRLDRARTVVEGSLQLCRWLLDNERGDLPGLLGRISHLVATPA